MPRCEAKRIPKSSLKPLIIRFAYQLVAYQPKNAVLAKQNAGDNRLSKTAHPAIGIWISSLR